MKKNNALPASKAARLFMVLAAFLLVGGSLPARDAQHQTVTQPGGAPGLPVMTGIARGQDGVTVKWDGPPGRYQVYRKQGVAGGLAWLPVGAPSATRTATIADVEAHALFKVSGPTPSYVGSRACAECHEGVYNLEQNTAHTHALHTLQQIRQDQNPACLPCHTVGFGLTSGFVSQTATPRLAGVQCENCHGPAAEHAANPGDPIVKPRADLASTICGGCHTSSHHPTYDEWKTSGHAIVTEDMNPTNRISSCGRCHSGSARLALLKDEPLPVGDANVAIECAVCHDPHQVTGNPAQLRNPLASTKDFFLSTSDNFQAKYDPSINVCAQCHNHRGAAWTNSGRPPHHSPQYNILLGTVGELSGGAPPNEPAAHAFLEHQCVSCHMQTKAFENEEHPAITGHSFKVETFEMCRDCHPLPEMLVEFTMSAVSSQIQDVKAALDKWATTKAPAELTAKYGTRAWEYTVPGSLSEGGPGPGSAEQALIPANIKKARFNLYLVLYDGSYGVHNGPYSITLLDTARNWVAEELGK
jgi:hypothetical protein